MKAFASVFAKGGSTVHYASALQDPHLFRTLFFLKAPYLVFDIVIAVILSMLCTKPEHRRLACRLWILNPLVLHTSYCLGQLDLIATLFLVLFLLELYRDRKNLAMVFLGLGGLAKLFPFYLMPAAVLLLSKNWRKRLILFLSAVAPSFAITWLSRDPLGILKTFVVLGGIYIKLNPTLLGIPRLPIIFLAVAYLGILWFALRQEKLSVPQLSGIFCILLLIFWAAVSFRPRHLVWISPLLILEIISNPILGAWMISLLVAISEIHMAGVNNQWGLLAPIDPTFFTSLPILDSFLSTWMDVRWVHRFCIAWSGFTTVVLCLLIARRHFANAKPKKFRLGIVIPWILVPLLGLLVSLWFGHFPSRDRLLAFKDISRSKLPSAWVPLVQTRPSVAQTFLSNFNGLFRVGVYIKINKDTPLERETLLFHLRENQGNGPEIRTVTLRGNSLKQSPHDFYNIPPDPGNALTHTVHFDFEPIWDSGGKKYYFSLEGLPQISNGTLEIGITPTPYYKGLKEGVYYRGTEMEKNKSLVFTTYCMRSPEHFDILKRFKAIVNQDRPFFRYYAGTLVLLLLGTLASFLKRVPSFTPPSHPTSWSWFQ